MPFKKCEFCQAEIPVARRTCPTCGHLLQHRRKHKAKVLVRKNEIIGLIGPALPEHQELLIPSDRDGTRTIVHMVKRLDSKCAWCGDPILNTESRAEEIERERFSVKLKHYHLGCHDAKEAGLKPPTRLR
jgi:predicted nucleic acid-binding Zn ribbon protein